MAKRLEIAGTGKVWIIQKCIECQLLDSDACCVIDNKHRPKFEEECENCPLPDATQSPADVWPNDDNHMLGPNGERLIAVNYAGPWDNCRKCFITCRHADDEKKCKAIDRFDRRNIHWELAGDQNGK